MQNAPFTTSNRQLAFALAIAGCSFAAAEDGGPAINIYTLDFLRARNIGKGKPIEEAAREAFERRIPGNVTYLFARDATFERTIKAWDGMHEEFQRAANEGASPILPDIAEETVAQVLFIHANSLKTLAEVPFIRTPLVSTVNASTKEVPIDGKPGTRKTVSGRGKIWSLGASPEIRKHLKL